jgi:transmembrane sensor
MTMLRRDTGTGADEVQADYDSLEQAARWFALLHVEHASAQQKDAWQAWLDERPQNRRAWRHVETVSHRFAPMRATGERQAAAVAMGISARQAGKRRVVVRSLAALAGTGLATWLGWRLTPLADTVLAWRSDHHTAVGEIRDLYLDDGTHIWLNTNSAIDVAFGQSRRLLQLRMGEIFVDTAKDAAGRPFFVETDYGSLQALGTRFSVRQQQDHACLAVFDGRVEIRNLSGQHVIVPAGQQRRFSASTIGESVPADAARQAWSRGVILAEDMLLGELIETLASYQYGHIGVAPEIAGLRVSGRYPVADFPKALGMLERDFPLHISRPLPWWISIGKK